MEPDSHPSSLTAAGYRSIDGNVVGARLHFGRTTDVPQGPTSSLVGPFLVLIVRSTPVRALKGAAAAPLISTVFPEDSISVEPRINDRIRVPEVRLVGAEGEQIGIVAIGEALRLAQEADLDLVEVAPDARPPVCKLMDYGKFKYESAQKAREARRNQVLTVIKEMKLRPKIDAHDYETKKGHVVRFLNAGDKVKVTIMVRGREQSRPELGFRLLQRLSADVAELGFVESAPKQDGRNMIMVLAPHKKPGQRHPQPAGPAAETA